jgi:hypothetical protein
MENMTVEVKAGKVIITITDVNYRGSLSASGKSKTVASSRGAVPVPGTDIKLSLNAYVKA